MESPQTSIVVRAFFRILVHRRAGFLRFGGLFG